MWNDHVAGRVREHHRLWDVLMFQAWLEEQGRFSQAPKAACAYA
jgi:asparagine synthase (glutamine-hydrolysing)